MIRSTHAPTHPPPETAARIAEEAAARGVTAEQWARDALAGLLDDWSEALRALDEAGEDVDADERTGEAIPMEEVLDYLKSLATDDPLPRPKARKLK